MQTLKQMTAHYASLKPGQYGYGTDPRELHRLMTQLAKSVEEFKARQR